MAFAIASNETADPHPAGKRRLESRPSIAKPATARFV